MTGAGELLAAQLRPVERLVRDATGPCGLLVALQSNPGGAGCVSVTSASARLLQAPGVMPQTPAGRVLAALLQGQRSACGDGGKLALALACRLVTRGVDSGLRRAPLLRGYRRALAACEAALEQLRRPISFADMDALRAVARGVLGTRGAAQLRPRAVDLLATQLLHAFVSSLHPEQLRPNVRVVALPGGDPMDSDVLADELVLDVPLAAGVAAVPGAFSVALFDESLELKRSAVLVPLEPGAVVDEAEAERAELARLGDALAAAGVRLVACQKLIPAFLQRHLGDRGVVALQRLSIRHVHGVQALSGARIQSSWSAEDLDADALGRLGGAEPLVAGPGRRYLRLRADPAWERRRAPVATLLLRGHDEGALDELKPAVEDALQVITGLMEDPAVVAGGGRAELALAAAVSAAAGGVRGAEGAAMRVAAECLEAQAAATEHELPAADVLLALERAGPSCGWDPEAQRPTARVADSVRVKVGAVQAAFDAAGVLLRVEGEVVDRR